MLAMILLAPASVSGSPPAEMPGACLGYVKARKQPFSAAPLPVLVEGTRDPPANFGVFWLLKEKQGKKMITGISGFGFFWSKNGRFVTHNLFFQKKAETPIFIVFWGVRVFWAKLSKKAIFGQPPKRKENFD